MFSRLESDHHRRRVCPSDPWKDTMCSSYCWTVQHCELTNPCLQLHRPCSLMFYLVLSHSLVFSRVLSYCICQRCCLNMPIPYVQPIQQGCEQLHAVGWSAMSCACAGITAECRSRARAAGGATGSCTGARKPSCPIPQQTYHVISYQAFSFARLCGHLHLMPLMCYTSCCCCCSLCLNLCCLYGRHHCTVGGCTLGKQDAKRKEASVSVWPLSAVMSGIQTSRPTVCIQWA